MVLIDKTLVTDSDQTILERAALQSLQRISTASSINQILAILSDMATTTNIGNHEELDTDKIIRSAVNNAYSVIVRFVTATDDRPLNLWSVLSFILHDAVRLNLKLDSKFEDSNYVLTVEHSMGGKILSLFITDLIVMIFQKLGKIKPIVNVSPSNNNYNRIFVNFPFKGRPKLVKITNLMLSKKSDLMLAPVKVANQHVFSLLHRNTTNFKIDLSIFSLTASKRSTVILFLLIYSGF